MEHKKYLKSLAYFFILFIIISVLWGVFAKKSIFNNGKKIAENNKVKFNKITANLMVESVNKTAAFYQDVFGFKIMVTVPDSGEYDFAIIQRDDVELMLQTKESSLKDLPFLSDIEIGGTFTLFIEVKGVEEIYENAKTKCELIQDLTETFYGMKEFSIKDPNGYLLSFAEKIED